jgi:hypothetical protein
MQFKGTNENTLEIVFMGFRISQKTNPRGEIEGASHEQPKRDSRDR